MEIMYVQSGEQVIKAADKVIGLVRNLAQTRRVVFVGKLISLSNLNIH